jgi:hypothetical protein
MSMNPDEPAAIPDDDAVAARLLEKLRVFVGALDDEERAVMAALLAPGVASAYTGPELEPEVVGFGMNSTPPERDGAERAWSPERLPDSLTDRIRDQGVRIEFD